MLKAQVSLSDAKKSFAAGKPEPQSGKSFTQDDVKDRDALVAWCQKSFGTVLMTSTSGDSDVVSVSYFA